MFDRAFQFLFNVFIVVTSEGFLNIQGVEQKLNHLFSQNHHEPYYPKNITTRSTKHILKTK